MKLRFSSIATIALCAALAAACGKKDEGAKTEGAAQPTTPPAEATKPTPTPPAADPAAEARKLYDTLCTTCHGPDGKGTGAAAANLDPKPRDYTDAEWQKTITDEKIAKAIVEGGAAVGMSPNMPPNPQLKDKPEVVAELVAIIRGFGPGDAAGADEAAEGDEGE